MYTLDLFYSEEFCVRFIRDLRMKTGVLCKKCGHDKHSWSEKRKRFRCTRCSRETTLRSGTAMEYSKLPLRYWVVALYFLACSKKPCSAAFLQRYLQHKYYEPIWAMLHKLRVTMGHRIQSDVREVFQASITEEFLVSENRSKRDDIAGSGVLVLIEMISDKSGEFSKSGGRKRFYIRMQALGQRLHFPTRRKDQKPAFYVDVKGVPSRIKIESLNTRKDVVASQKRHIYSHKDWVRVFIENLKRNILGIYHHVDENYFQNYLSEYCYLTNWRFNFTDKMNNIFQLLVVKPWYQIDFPEELAKNIQSSEMVPSKFSGRVSLRV